VPKVKAASVLPTPVGELPKRAGGAGVRIRAEQISPGPNVPFLGQRLVTDAFVIGLGSDLLYGLGMPGSFFTNSGS